ncbi:hypothetical protein ACJJTC_003112 [Scirpophaga incertulas]
MFNSGEEPSWQRNRIIRSNPLALVYNEGQWRLNKMSPLYNFQYNQLKLKQYASKIRQALVGIVSVSSLKYTVKLEEQDNLRYCEEDSNGLMLTVTSTQENIKKSKVAYCAVFLSWGLRSQLEGTTHLPYMLERGEQRVGAAVKTVLQTLFDCNIQHFHFNQHQLLEFGFNLIESDASKSTDQFTLIYKTPQVDHKDKLNLSFDIGDVNIIWNGIKKERATKKSELINMAYQILQNQIYHMLMLDITVFDLCEVILPKVEIKNGGYVKMKTPEVINSVFTVLNEITHFLSDTDSSMGSLSS